MFDNGMANDACWVGRTFLCWQSLCLIIYISVQTYIFVSNGDFLVGPVIIFSYMSQEQVVSKMSMSDIQNAFWRCSSLRQSNIHMPHDVYPFLIAKFMGPTWGPSGANRTQVGPMLAPWTLLSGSALIFPSTYIYTKLGWCNWNKYPLI